MNGRRRAAPGPLALALWAWAAGWLACASPLPKDELPDAPIAMLYWEREEARRRNDVIEQAQAPARAALNAVLGEGIATEESLGQLLGFGKAEEKALSAQLDQWPGRLVLYHPRLGTLETVEAAGPGARPLAWSRDHRSLLFTTDHLSGSWQLYAYDLDTKVRRPLTRGPASHYVGDWDAERRLVYATLEKFGRGLRAQVIVTGPDGVGETVVVDGPTHANVRFTPDGRGLILVRPDPSGGSRPRPPFLIYRPLDPADGEERVVARGRQPAVAADGSWVVYSAASADGWRLVRVRPDGSARSPVGRSPRDQGMPAVSPDGHYVVYVAQETDFDQLFIRRIDGSGDRILLDEGSAAWPVW